MRDDILTYGTASEQVLVNFWEIESLSPFGEFDYNWYFNAGSTPSFAAATASSTGGPVGCYIDGDEVMGIRAAPPY